MHKLYMCLAWFLGSLLFLAFIGAMTVIGFYAALLFGASTMVAEITAFSMLIAACFTPLGLLSDW